MAALSFSSLLLVPLGVAAGAPGAVDSALDVEAVAGEVRLQCARALLEPDERQTLVLVAVAERLAAERERYLESRLSLLQVQRAAFDSFREEDLDGGEFAPDTEQAAARANGLDRPLREGLVESIASAEREVRRALGPGHLLLLDELQPEDFARCALGPPARAPGEPLPRRAWGALEDVRGLRGPALARCAGRAAEEILALAAREGRPSWEREAELQRMITFLERAATLSERTAERCRGALTQALLPRTRDQRSREELERVHLEEYPTPSTLSRLLLTDGAPAILRGIERPDASRYAAEVRRLEAEVAWLREDISLLNLINGLHLSRAQLQAFSEAGSGAGREPYGPPRALPSALVSVGVWQPVADSVPAKGAAARQLTLEMKRVRASLARGELPPAKAVQEIWELAGLQRAAAQPAQTPSEDLAARARGVLSHAQQHVLLDFRTCLIPIPELKNPVRVGQAGSNEQEVRELEKVRAIPDERYAEKRERLADGALARIERSEGSFPPQERVRRVQELAALFDEARALDAAAFALSAPELAERLRSFQYAPALRASLRPETSRLLHDRSVRFLLDPAFAPLAREVLARRTARSLPDPVDLSAITPAPSCKDGSCAVD